MIRDPNPKVLICFVTAVLILLSTAVRVVAFDIVRDGQPRAKVFVDTRGAQGNNDRILRGAADWFGDAVERATGAELETAQDASDGPVLVLARADQYPEPARRAGIHSESLNAFAVVTSENRAYILGRSEVAVRHGVATVLHRMGFRYFNPSPRWWITPDTGDLSIEETFSDAPDMRGRRIWYAYGVRKEELKRGYSRWAEANRMGSPAGFHTGHSYGNIVNRNREEFEKHPEYMNLLENGERYELKKGRFAGKLCYSNPGLVDLVVADRIRLLQQRRERNPYAFMVSMDPSDGGGTCHCERCKALGTTTDRVIYLANHVAKGLRKKYPDAWVGLYGYSSHRLPPTIEVEPNVYVQVAMAFNRTQYTLPQLVSRWSEKVSMLGLREYYGVEHWDWGLPGRMRGASVDYHRRWIPYYHERNVNAINAESNCNWGAQSLGFYVATRMMWDTDADVEEIIDDYYQKAFGEAAGPMRKLQAKFDERPQLRVFDLLPIFRDLKNAHEAAQSEGVHRCVVDMMSYLHYVLLYRDYTVEGYDALKALMNYAYRTRYRQMVHYYALARRLCNAKPLRDGRPEFHMYGHEVDGEKKPPIWKYGEQLEEEKIVRLFHEDLERLENAPNPYVSYTSPPARVRFAGADQAGPGGGFSKKADATAQFRHELGGVLIADAAGAVAFTVRGIARNTSVRVTGPANQTLLKRDVGSDESVHLTVNLPGPGVYPVQINGRFQLTVPHDTPLVFKAGYDSPAWISYSGPHYFYVPKGTERLLFSCGPRLSLIVPGQGRRDFSSKDYAEGTGYVALDVPEGTDGQLWRTMNQTRGSVKLINVPPFMSFYPDRIVVPREVAEEDGLKVGWTE